MSAFESPEPELGGLPPTEHELGDAVAQVLPQAMPPRDGRGWRSRWLRRTLRGSGIALVILIGLVVAGFFWASSAVFQEMVRQRIVNELAAATGGRVEIAAFRWDVLHLSAEVDGVTIHGTEAAGEAPYLHVDHLSLRVGLLNLFTLGEPTRAVLREAVIDRPEFHLIVYPDGSTNQPHPQHPSKSKPVMDTLFEAEIGHLAVQQGTVLINDKAYPLQLDAKDVALALSWVPDPRPLLRQAMHLKENDSAYRIHASLGELAFAQGKYAPVPSSIDASVLLFHDGVQVDSLTLAAPEGTASRTLTLRGRLTGFAHPVWQAQAGGQVDLRVLAPYAGFANTHEGIVTLNASVSGRGGQFVANGSLTSDAIHYQDAVVDAHTGAFSAKFRGDARQLLVSDVRIKLAQGGEMDGQFQFDNWLDNTPTPAAQLALRRKHQSWPIPTGAVKATLNGISLDTILAMLATPPYRHLGLDAVVTGPATANWTSFADDLQIGGQLAMHPSAKPVPGEVPVEGFTDSTYHTDSGSVKVQTLEVHLPHSALVGKGSLGVYPVDRASEMDLDIKSSDLSEFDGVLRTLNLTQGNRRGAAALPLALRGQLHFNGQLNSSWLTPRVEGRVTATNIGLQTSPFESPAVAGNPDIAPRFTDWDSLDVEGLYTPGSVVIHHGLLRRGAASLTLQGHLDSHDPEYRLSDAEPEFDERSFLGLKAEAKDFPLGDLLPLAGVTAPIAGKLTAQLEVQGPLSALAGAGNVDVADITAYGERIEHLHAVGAIGGAVSGGGKLVKITSLTVQQAGNGAGDKSGGRITASGSYDLGRRVFQIDARGAAIDLGSIERLKQVGVAIDGKLGFTVIGDGSVGSDGSFDPHLQAHATFSGMNIGGEPVADLLVSATSARHSVSYQLDSHQPAGEFTAQGETQFDTDFTTEASLQFAKFDIGGLLKLFKVTGITGQSALEGSAKISGPLAHPEKLRGEASLNELAVVVETVHLASRGAAHATLADGVARLDPLEITGEDTDLKLHGSLALMGKQQLDVEASGSVNLKLAESLDPDLIATGVTNFQVAAHGPLSNPILQGRIEFRNNSLAMEDFPNGLSQIQGTLEFIQNRLEVRSLTAMSGGGQLSVSGYLGFQHGLYADLMAKGEGIRIRYPQGISSLANATLRLQGPQNNLQLGGNVEVTRFAINSDLDIAAFATQAKSVQPIVPPDAPSNHVHLDVHLTSAPQLNFQNAFAKLAGDVDLHLRGTLASPSLLGRISLTEGSTSIGGTRYELQRGDIYFNNPVRIQPNIDLDATARVEDYDITLGLHGTPEKLNVTYRSEPPLPEADVIALLALGRTQDEQSSAYAQQQQQAGDNPTTDALLGGALNATVSNRVQRLFGTGAIKVDPNFIGSLGNSSARVTVVEQIGKNLTFTYASNVNTTTQQLIQAEIAINRHISLLVTQDESGIFSMVFKARRRYK